MNIVNTEKIFEEAYQKHKENNFETAEKLYQQILDIDPNHFKSIYLLGSLFAQTKKLNKAKDLLQRALQINPEYEDAYYNLGNVLIGLEDRQEAIVCFKKTIQINPEHADAHNNLGNLFKEAEKIQEAEKSYERAIQINPNYFNAYNNLGSIFQKYKDFNKAIKLYEKTIQLNPNFVNAYYNLGLIFHELEEYKKAISYYEKAIKIKQDYSEVYAELGKIFKELGNLEKAIDYFEKTREYKSDDLVSLFHLAQLKNKILDSTLENNIVQIINNKKCTKTNLAFGNYLLSIYEFKKKNYKKEFNYLLKGHSYYFDSQKEKFKNINIINYLLKISSELDKLLNFKNNEKIIKKNNEKIKPIFIIGVPRCGSTLVEKVIASGDNYIPIGEETGIFHSVINEMINQNLSAVSDINTIQIKIIEKYNQRKLIQEKNDNIFTDKSLENIFYLRLIKEIFPNSKVIYCKRNPLSVVISIIKNNLGDVPWAHNPEHIFKYLDICFNEIQNFKDIYPDFIYELDYEKFVKNSETESKKLLNFCNLSWNKRCLEFYKRKELISQTASNTQIRKAIYKDSIDKYLPYREFLINYGNNYSWFK